MNEFESLNLELLELVDIWEQVLLQLPEDVICHRRNDQKRTIKQIVGHLVDSASNNTHRIIHLQYQNCPFAFPDYANLGNNDRWISIQNYQDKNWCDLICLWKYLNKHIVHVIRNVNTGKLDNEWITALGTTVPLKSMIIDYIRHFKLHLGEIKNLMEYKGNETW